MLRRVAFMVRFAKTSATWPFLFSSPFSLVHTNGKVCTRSGIPTVGLPHAQTPTTRALAKQFILFLGVQLSIRTSNPPFRMLQL